MASLLIEVKFQIGQTVYLITDEDQHKRMVTTIWISPEGIRYELSKGSASSYHYAIEIAEEQDVLIKV